MPNVDSTHHPESGSAAESELPEHVRANREAWDRYATDFVEPGRKNWGTSEVSWGIWSIPEAELRLLPDDVSDQDVVELGCGTGYVSAWLARRGARPVGIDNSPEQLRTARRFQEEFGLEFPIHLGNAETTPFDDEQFDGAVSEYGAALWADPYAWIPEAHRILKPGGWLMFLTNSALAMITIPDEGDDEQPAGTELLRPYFGMHRMVWQGDTSVEFHLPHGEWIRLLRTTGFEIEKLVEIQAPLDATTRYTGITTAEWANKWPSEEAWVVRKRG
jgi:SAM-dependent methyltransferase